MKFGNAAAQNAKGPGCGTVAGPAVNRFGALSPAGDPVGVTADR